MAKKTLDLGDPDRIRDAVRKNYGQIAREATSGSGGLASRANETARRIGYSDEEINSVPEGANLGLGCGNPTAIDSLRAGEVVVDLGSGAGFDALLAARKVGPTGRVIGVDMTDGMLENARANAEKLGLTNVDFREGPIEELPIESETVDVVISNCVINLSPEKARVFSEAARVLRPGGRLMVSDVVLERSLPQEIAESIAAYLGCVGGASVRADYLETIRTAGFREVKVAGETPFDILPDDLQSLSDPGAAEFAHRFGLDPDDVRRMLAQLGVGLGTVRGILKGVKSLQVHAIK